MIPDPDSERHRLESLIRERLGSPIRALEAGCGRQWPLDLAGLDVELVGVDTNAASLAIRSAEVGDLDETVCADLSDVEFPDASFDLIYCSYVLEHLARPDTVLDRFAHWIRPGGLIVLRVPDRSSVWAAVTRITPHQVHVLFRRHLLRVPDAGSEGHGPFPVVYHPAMGRHALRSWAGDAGLRVELEAATNHYVHRLGRWRPFVGAFTATVQRLSGGRLRGGHNNLILVVGR